jgi:L-asparaginase II
MTSVVCIRSRGGVREAVHWGAIALAEGGFVRSLVGDIEAPVFPRSAIKPIHALAFLVSGAADQLSATDEDIALVAASHSAGPLHLAALAHFATKLGVEEGDLICGPDTPLGRGRRQDDGPITAFHNNNAGKHLGMIAMARALKAPVAGYHHVDHPAFQAVLAAQAMMCDAPVPSVMQTENCGLPTTPMQLSALALGMARLADPARLSPNYRAAAQRLCEAIAAKPDFLAGPRRLPTEIARITGGRVIAKGGSEGVYAVADRAKGRGYALKIADGSGEVASALVVELLAHYGSLAPEEAEALRAFTQFWRHPYAPERSPKAEFFLGNEFFLG